MFIRGTLDERGHFKPLAKSLYRHGKGNLLVMRRVPVTTHRVKAHKILEFTAWPEHRPGTGGAPSHRP